jgi:hypothetical protein
MRREEDAMDTQPLYDFEPDDEPAEQRIDETQHLLAGYRRLTPTQRAALLELIDDAVEGYLARRDPAETLRALG